MASQVFSGGGGGGRGPRATWEQRQQAAELAAAAARLPALARSKPAFLAAQIQPVLSALRLAALFGDSGSNSGSSNSSNSSSRTSGSSSSDEQDELRPAAGSGQQHATSWEWLPEASAQLQRLAAIDRHAGANTSLLLFLLLGSAVSDNDGGAGGDVGDDDAASLLPLLQLIDAVGWQQLVLQALPLLPQSQARRLEHGLVAAAAAAAEAGDGGAPDGQRQAALQQLVLRLTRGVQQHLDTYLHPSSSGNGATLQPWQLDDIALLQQLLLVCPSAAAHPPAAGALRQLQATADASMARVMRGMQQRQGEQQQQHQPFFQQLCQLRARLMLATAAAAACASGTEGGSGACQASEPSDGDASQASAAQAWGQVLQMPPKVPSAAAASGSPAVPSITRQQFLAACVASLCLLQATSGTKGSHHKCGASTAGGATQHQGCPRQDVCPALPGVHFELPPLPSSHTSAAAYATCGVRSTGIVRAAASGAATELVRAADAAASELAQDPGCLEPAQLMVAALQLAAGQAKGAAASALVSALSEQEAPPPAAAASSWNRLLQLAAAAAAKVSDRNEQRQLLLLLLHGQQPWQSRLRLALQADAALQQRCRQELVAVANRFSAGGNSAGRTAAAVVHGEERRRRTAAAVLALMPHALLCPEAVLERLVGEALVQPGEQVNLLLDVLREMQPLAAYCPNQQQQQAGIEPPTVLLRLLAQMLVPGSSSQPQLAMLDTQGSRQALIQLVGGLCGAVPHGMARPATGKGAAAGAVSPGSGELPLVSAAAMLRHVVAPALRPKQQHQQQQRHEQYQQQQPQQPKAANMLLPLQLADLLVATTGDVTAGGGEQSDQLVVLLPLLTGLLELEGRRIDRSPAVLQATGVDTLELAAELAQRLGIESCSCSGASRYFTQQLQIMHSAAAQAQPAQRLQQLRQGMLRLLAALLPCCTAAEAREVLQAALPAAIQAAMMQAAAPAQEHLHFGGASASASSILPGALAAAVEAACRAARTLALRPDQAPIAGEQLPASSQPPASADAMAAARATAPTVLRQVAVEHMLRHLVLHSVRLAGSESNTAGPPPPLPPGGSPPLRLTAAEAQALGLRCFKELCQLVAALQAAGYNCATPQAGLLRLAQQLLHAPAANRCELEQGRVTRTQQPASIALDHVKRQLEAAARLLPEGRLREVALLGIEQAAGAAAIAP
ncbi:hypothetical protein D9Q98_003332 [Chlorella vulgaris]|uniref:Uncharacterized protein n=1 Tax=Chlorella vulgaris TaxID=3077 RepID=A0A9D4TSJ7_CHLVU|nr:hypothetical protein D9Q98_003332 [Chlorella vulgaris]